MTINEKIAVARSLINEAQRANRIISVDFIKKDGSLRHMLCHRAKALEDTVSPIPSEATIKRKATLKANNMVSVEELTMDGEPTHQFRTINLATVTKIGYGSKSIDF